MFMLIIGISLLLHLNLTYEVLVEEDIKSVVIVMLD